MIAEPALTREQARDIDRRAIEAYGLPGLVLMENAGRGCAELLLDRGVRGPVTICCGPGNNGGDGYVIARHLDLAGVEVRLLVFGDPARLTGDAATMFGVVQRSGLPLEVFTSPPAAPAMDRCLATAEWIVDALLGTGARGELREPCRTAAAAIVRAGKPVLAVDLPSGLDPDTGQPARVCVRADVTATFVAWKVGFRQPVAAEWLGEVVVVEIGAPRKLLAEFGVQPARRRDRT